MRETCEGFIGNSGEIGVRRGLQESHVHVTVFSRTAG